MAGPRSVHYEIVTYCAFFSAGENLYMSIVDILANYMNNCFIILIGIDWGKVSIYI
jgi:hypothetical protein